MGMIAHGVTDHIGRFIIAPVLQFVQGMQDAPLDGFEAIVHFRHSPVKDDVTGIFEKPVSVHILDMIRPGRTLRFIFRKQRRLIAHKL